MAQTTRRRIWLWRRGSRRFPGRRHEVVPAFEGECACQRQKTCPSQPSSGSQLDAIPTVGPSSWIGSWWAGFRFLINGLDVIQEGYDEASAVFYTSYACLFTIFQYKRAPYKVAAFDRWLVVVSSREHMEELRRAPEDTLSLIEYANDVSFQLLPAHFSRIECHQQELQADYTFGPEVRHNPYHIGILHSQISRNIGVLCPEIRDEIITAFGDILHLRDTGEHLTFIRDHY